MTDPALTCSLPKVPMSGILTDPPLRSCYHLFFDAGILQSQSLAPDLFCVTRGAQALHHRELP